MIRDLVDRVEALFRRRPTTRAPVVDQVVDVDEVLATETSRTRAARAEAERLTNRRLDRLRRD